MRGIEGVGTMESVLDGGQFWVGGDPVLVSVWRSVGDELTSKGELDV